MKKVDAPIYEYACHEGNHAVRERAAAVPPSPPRTRKVVRRCASRSSSAQLRCCWTALRRSWPAAQARRQTLDIYVMDVEGGNATLFVPPSGESVLIDSGNGGRRASRDADRIMAAAADAGISRIDHLITTHWHGDHFGGMAELANRIPIRHYVDHGANVQPAAAADEFLQRFIRPYGQGHAHRRAAGDTISVSGLDWRDRRLGRQAADSRAAGRRATQTVMRRDSRPGTDRKPQSVGSIITFGRFRVAHMGDLTWNKEFELMCPTNQIGTVDSCSCLHHGQGFRTRRCSCTRWRRASRC